MSSEQLRSIGRCLARPSAALVALLLIFGLNQLRYGGGALQEIDEAAWLFSGCYQELYSGFDFDSPAWRHPDAVDHPPLAKYLFGATSRLANYRVAGLNEKEWWARHDLDLLVRGQFVAALREMVPPRALWLGRAAGMAAMFCAALLLYRIAWKHFSSPWTATLAALLFALSPYTLEAARLVTADALYVFLLAAITAVQVRLLDSAEFNFKQLLPPAILLGALCGLHINTKITGLLSWGTSAACLLLVYIRGRVWKPAVAAFAACGLAALFTALALNPSWWENPFAFISGMFGHRWERVGLQSWLFYGEALPTAPFRAATFLKRLLLDSDPVFAAFRLPVLLAGFSFACVLLWQRRRSLPPGALFLAGTAVLWFFATMYSYRLDWWRYLLPALPFVALASAWGLVNAVREWRAAVIAPAAVVTVCLLAAALLPDRAGFERRNAAWLAQAKARQLEILLAFHPEDPVLLRESAMRRGAAVK